MISIRCLMLLAAMVATTINLVQSSSSEQKLCALRAGVKTDEIKDVVFRNDKCSVDCVTKASVVMTFFVSEGKVCNDMDDYHCLLGKCIAKDSEPDTSGLIDPEIIIHEAIIDDRDPLPTTGLSDGFVTVELAENSGPSYNIGDVICYTHVVVDNSHPIWNTRCKPSPLKSHAQLKFVVLDSDKPRANPDLLGIVDIRLDSVANRGKQTLPLRGGSGNQSITFEIVGVPYNRS